MINLKLSKKESNGRITTKRDVRLEEAKIRFPIKIRLKKTLEEHLKENPESGPKPRKIVERQKIIQ